MTKVILIVAAALLLLFSVNSTVAPFFVVNETQRAIKLFLGEIEDEEYLSLIHI